MSWARVARSNHSEQTPAPARFYSHFHATSHANSGFGLSNKLTTSFPFALSLSKGLAARPFDRLRANGLWVMLRANGSRVMLSANG